MRILCLFESITQQNDTIPHNGQYFNLCFLSEGEDDGTPCQLYQHLRPIGVFNTCRYDGEQSPIPQQLCEMVSVTTTAVQWVMCEPASVCRKH